MSNELNQVQPVIDMLLSDRQAPKVLDAGCGLGSKTYISLPDNVYMVGIDISEKQLLKNTLAREKILGDIQSYDLPPSEFDVIICWWVLEHLQYPDKALKNFLHAAKDDGIIILAVPNVFSIKGLLTKYSPQWVHNWYYRSILGNKGYSPFPTYLKFSISPASLRRFAIENNLSIAYSRLYKFREKNKIIGVAFWTMRQTVKAVTLGKIDPGLSEFIIILKKQKVSATHAPDRSQIASGVQLRS
jgi:2-polyprenyl-3-methyl-5-hydroxy-6-metoxy-1,4-benzoquinol methylase